MQIIKNALFLILFCSGTIAYAQQTYLSDVWGLIYKYDASDCSFELIVDSERPIFDIALHPNGNLYALSNDNILFEIDTINGATMDVHFFGDESINNSLAIDGKGEIFVAGTSLLSYNIASGESIDYGPLPGFADGDLLFYKGDLYLSISNNKVIEVNLNNLDASAIVAKSNINIGLWGLFTTGNDCNDIRAFGASGGIPRVIEINFETESLDYICDIPFEVTGATSTSDYLAPEISSLTSISSSCEEPSGSIEINIAGGLGPFETYINQISNNQNLQFNNLDCGDYSIYVKDSRDCDVTIDATVLQGECPVYFPNVFSPNNDGTNDFFSPEFHPNFKGTIESYSIFDRWGNKIVSMVSPDKNQLSWNGKLKGQPLNPQVFTYLLVLKDNDGSFRKHHGDFSLLR